MISKIILAMTLVTIGLDSSQAQQRTTKETKIIIVVDEKTNDITAMELFDEMANQDKQSIQKAYPNSKFYVGLLEGRYTVEGRRIVSALNTTITMLTTKEYFTETQVFPTDQFSPGDAFNIGKIKAKVIASKKGEITIKTE